MPAGSDFVAISAGSFHNLALQTDGHVEAWGQNDYAQCDTPAVDNFAMIAAGGFHSLAIRDNRPHPPILNRVKVPAAKTAKKDANASPATPGMVRFERPTTGPSVPDTAVKQTTPPEAQQKPRPTTVPEVNQPKGKDTAAKQTTPPEVQPKEIATPRPATAAETNQPKDKDIAVKRPNAAKPEQAQAAEPRQVQTPGTSTTDVTKTDTSRPSDSAADPSLKPSNPPAQASAKPNPDARQPASGAAKPAATPAREPDVAVNLNDPVRQGLSDDLYMSASGSAVPVYHFSSVSATPGGAAGSRQHFWTISEEEKYKLIDTQSSTWKYEGIAFFAYSEGRQPPGARPMYRFWSQSLNRYFFTMDEAQKQMLTDNPDKVWQYQGIAWYTPPVKAAGKK